MHIDDLRYNYAKSNFYRNSGFGGLLLIFELKMINGMKIKLRRQLTSPAT